MPLLRRRPDGRTATLNGNFQGTAQAFGDSLRTQPSDRRCAGSGVYRAGLLYESYIHPLTILSTLPSAGVGAADFDGRWL
jgi:HAE1 family hydrophobic/amphiphilic exporter-1